MELQDKIGRQDIVDKICGLVDSLKKDQNFCLSINGAWGSGKSFVLRMIEEKLSKKQEYVIIKYDAWANAFYADPLIAILSCIIDGVDEKLYLVEQYEKKIKNSVKTTANTLAKISTKIKKLKDIVVGIKEIMQTFHNPIDMQTVNDFKSYQKLLKETKEVLNEITQKGEYREKQTKLIILVDEIDRCLPNEQLVILERLHHLFDIKNCAVIVAMNQQCIFTSVQSLYGINGSEYLRKFFNLTFKLDTSASKFIESLLKGFVGIFEKLGRPSGEYVIPIKLAYQCLLYSPDSWLNKIDNREISRFYDSLLNVCNDFGWEKLTQQQVFFIIMALFIRRNISSTFLSEREILENQQRINDGDTQRDVLDYSARQEMPYFDYIMEYIGIDRGNLPESLYQLERWVPSRIPEFSWHFNEIVYYSLGKEFHGNSMRAFFHKPVVKSEDCQRLRQLIILYGGEQEKCDK